MTQVDFYILPGTDLQQRMQFACRLTDKAYRLGHRVYIHTQSAQQTGQLDDLLWTFQQSSFIPHAVFQTTGDGDAPPVQLGHDGEPDASHEVLINLAREVPLFFSRFERVAELIDGDDDTRRQGRRRYSFYKERGYPLRTHEIRN
jgi:DNA polymerase-3 subunit chi